MNMKMNREVAWKMSRDRAHIYTRALTTYVPFSSCVSGLSVGYVVFVRHALSNLIMRAPFLFRFVWPSKRASYVIVTPNNNDIFSVED